MIVFILMSHLNIGDQAKSVAGTVSEDGEASNSDKRAMVDLSMANSMSGAAINHVPDIM